MTTEKISQMTPVGRPLISTDMVELSISDGMGGWETKSGTASNIYEGFNQTYGPLIFQGTWNASTNTPSLSSGTGTKGYVYVVSVAGSTNLDGITVWNVGDWAVFNGTVWEKLTGSAAVTNSGSSTDNALARFDGTTGKLIKNSVGILDNSGNLSGLLSVSLSGSDTLFNFNGTTSNTVTTLAGTSGATGTAASSLTISLGAAGNSTGSNTGGAGAALNINGSNGGNSDTGTSGSGGSIIITAGNAGSSTSGGGIGGSAQLRAGAGSSITSGATQAGSGQLASVRGGAGGAQQGTGKGGTGGGANLIGGAGGTPTNGNGGNSGAVSITAGTPTAATSTNGTGGTAGNALVQGIAGGNGNGSGAGGAGSTVAISAGFGGIGGATGNGGAGGPVTITAGTGGAAPGSTGGAGANVLITSGTGGSGSVAGSDGNIRLTTHDTSVDLRSNGSSVTSLRFYNAGSTQYVGLQAGTLSGNTTYILPTDFPSSTQFMQSTNAGVFSFASAVTSITAGTNLTGGTITSTGTIALSSTPSGLTSIGVGNLSLIADSITGINGITLVGVSNATPIILSPNNSFVAITDFGNAVAGQLRFYNANSTHYVGFKTTTGLSSDTVWTLPTANVTNGLLTTDGSNNTSFTLTPSGLTSLGVGNISITGDRIRGANGVLIDSTGSGQAISLAPKGSAQVRIFSQDSSIAVPLRFYNAAGDHYVEFKADSALTSDTSWTFPQGDRYGVFTSDGSGILTVDYAPAIQKPLVSFNSTSKTLALSDKNTYQVCNNGSTQTITIPPHSSVAFLDGVEIDFFQQGAGQVVFVAGSGVTILSAFSNLKVGAQYTGATIKQIVTDTWALVGNLTA